MKQIKMNEKQVNSSKLLYIFAKFSTTDMKLSTDLQGRLRNISLPLQDSLLPLFEAVVNSIHAIDERKGLDKNFTIDDARIAISIIRDGDTMDSSIKGELVGFKITDNGVGFTQENYESFQTLDSTYKIDKGCKGIGRLLWLKEFSYVEVNSIYSEANKKRKRTFRFSIHPHSSDTELDVEIDNSSELTTTVSLLEIDKKYQKIIPKKTETIAKALLEHCLWYFIREGGAPIITIEDGNDACKLNAMFDEFMAKKSDIEEFKIKGQKFFLTHVKYQGNTDKKNSILYSANDRLVMSESVKNIPGLFGTMSDESGDFYYLCFVDSPYLGDHVSQERNRFDIPEEDSSGLFNDEITFSEIRQAVTEKIKVYLRQYLTENCNKGRETLENFVTKEAPRYRNILKRLSDDEKVVNPNISKKELDRMLHAHYSALEDEIIAEGHDLMKPGNIDDIDTYSAKLEEYLSKVTDIKQSDLANYVAHRKVVIDLLEKALEKDDNGKYVRENVVHKLIMPMIATSDDVQRTEDVNLWLIDDRLTFHNYLASDKTISSMPITSDTSNKEPDILSLNAYDNPMFFNEKQSIPFASLTIIELKRPMRDDASDEKPKSPIAQVLDYLDRIRKGKVTTANGRPISNASSLPAFCYIICDLTQSIIDLCEEQDMRKAYDGLSYYKHHEVKNAYIEVISFDKLLQGAKERNKAFFDKLGLPTT